MSGKVSFSAPLSCGVFGLKAVKSLASFGNEELDPKLPRQGIPKTITRILVVFSAANYPLSDYIMFACKLNDYQRKLLLLQGPKAILAEQFDIEARAALRNPTKDQMRLMTSETPSRSRGEHHRCQGREMRSLGIW